MSKTNHVSAPKKRYHITITEEVPIFDKLVTSTVFDSEYDEVSIHENRNVTPVYKAGSKKVETLIPSAKTVLSMSGIRIDHSVIAKGLHTMLDPMPISNEDCGDLSKEDLGAVLFPEDVPDIDTLERQARVSADRSLARTLKKNRKQKEIRTHEKKKKQEVH